MNQILYTFLIYSIVGTILHFIYKISNKNIVVGIFSSVNESTWEHIKILLTPIFIFNTILYVLKYQNNYFVALLSELLIAIFGIIILYEIKLKLFGNKKPVLNILIFYIAAILCSFIGVIIKNIYVPNSINIISMFGTIVIYLLYMLFTVCPPKKDLFKDPITGSYGINCVNR